MKAVDLVTVSGFAILTGILLLGLFIALAFAEGVLVKHKKKKAAIALICIVFALMTFCSYSLSHVHHGSNFVSYDTYDILLGEDTMDAIGELDIISDQDNKVLGFGMLQLDSGNSLKYLKLEFDEQGTLVGEKEAMQYGAAIRSSLSDLPVGKLYGTSMNQTQLEKLAFQGDKRAREFEPDTFIQLFLISNIGTVILIVINIFSTRRMVRQKQKSVDQIKIQDL